MLPRLGVGQVANRSASHTKLKSPDLCLQFTHVLVCRYAQRHVQSHAIEL